MKLLILDFAGTLSLETVLFGRRGNLEKELAKSGLAGLGVRGAGLFWNELVLPGWEEGSRTARGYAAVLAERLRVFTRARGIPAPEKTIRAAARAFARAYFEASPISGVWKKTLTALAAAPDSLTLIATDHYADAGRRIQSLLAAWGIEALVLPQTPPPAKGGRPFLIANSADFGAHKAEAPFWQAVRAALGRDFSCIRLVDDFGFNENTAGAYGGPAKARARQERTGAAILAAFGLAPGVFPFFLENPAQEDEAALRRAFEGLARQAQSYIEAPDKGPDAFLHCNL
jgi:hypothetical protein